MKKIHILLFAAFAIIISSCTKDYPVPVYTPEKNTWIVNTDTLGPADFTYYDTAKVIYGGIKGKASVTVKFAFKPTSDGKFVLREKADEYDEVTVLIIDSVKKIAWISTDNDGRQIKKEQFADITVSGKNVGISFNDLFLRKTDNVDMAKTSVNISY